MSYIQLLKMAQGEETQYDDVLITGLLPAISIHEGSLRAEFVPVPEYHPAQDRHLTIGDDTEVGIPVNGLIPEAVKAKYKYMLDVFQNGEILPVRTIVAVDKKQRIQHQVMRDITSEPDTATQECAACPACHRPWDGYRTCICKMDIELIVCSKCFRFWDGCTQCNCDNCLICGKHYSDKCICCEENSFVVV